MARLPVGLIADGSRADGSIADGLVADWSIADGSIAAGLMADGSISDGTVTDTLNKISLYCMLSYGSKFSSLFSLSKYNINFSAT